MLMHQNHLRFPRLKKKDGKLQNTLRAKVKIWKCFCVSHNSTAWGAATRELASAECDGSMENVNWAGGLCSLL